MNPANSPLDTGFACPDHGVTPDFRTVVGSLLPHCHRCDRIVVQVEATDGSVF